MFTWYLTRKKDEMSLLKDISFPVTEKKRVTMIRLYDWLYDSYSLKMSEYWNELRFYLKLLLCKNTFKNCQ